MSVRTYLPYTVGENRKDPCLLIFLSYFLLLKLSACGRILSVLAWKRAGSTS